MRNYARAADDRVMGKIAPSMAFEEFSGSIGDRVVAKSRAGMATRGKPKYRYPKVAAVQEGNARLKAANDAWNAMTVAQAEAWNRYAEGLPLKTGFDGTRYRTAGKNALVALAAKFLQANPGMPVPLVPPTGAYIGPSVAVSVASSSGSLSFAASGATPPGTVVELLVQPLLNGKRSPTKFYKSVAFVAFDAAHPSAAIPVQAGWYAAGYRFVERATGRATTMRTLGKIEVA